jgi:hypothetical protein
MNIQKYCASFVKNYEKSLECSSELRWYDLTIPLGGPVLYMDRNEPSLKTGVKTLLSICTSTVLLGFAVKGIECLTK